MPKSEAEYTCAVGTGAKAKEACNEEESIYGRSLWSAVPHRWLRIQKRWLFTLRCNTYRVRLHSVVVN